MTRPSFIERFWSKVERGLPNECWLWTAGKTSRGYGTIRLTRGGTAKAHRVAWELANGLSVPSGMFVCHTCDTPACVNPAHLWIGTAADNSRDRHTKGRTRNGHSGKTHCIRGHEFTPETTYLRANKAERGCRPCRSAARLASARRVRAQAAIIDGLSRPSENVEWLMRAGPIAKRLNEESTRDGSAANNRLPTDQ